MMLILIQASLKDIKKIILIYWDDIPYAKPPINNLRWKAPSSINQPQKLILPKIIIFVFKKPSSLGGANGDGIM